MRKSILVTALIFMLPALARAEAKLVGKWKLSSNVCSSGKPMKTGSEYIDSQLTEFLMNFEADVAEIKTTSYNKATAAKVAIWIENMETSLKQATDRNEPTEKPKENLEIARKYAAGVTCTVQSKTRISLKDGVLHSEKTLEQTSDCPGVSALNEEDSDSDVSIVELSDEKLVLTDVNAESSDDGVCPKGDRTVVQFTRVR